jgi:hypothetical protein
MKEKVTFETNVPVSVVLAQTEGMDVQGRYGDEVMYNLQDGRVMFVPVSIRDEIRKLEVKPGEPLQVCKRQVEVLGEACIEWTVSRRECSQGPKALQVVQRKLEAAGLVVTGCSKLSNHTGWQLCCAGGEVVNVFDTGRVLVQGKNDARVRSILGLDSVKGEQSAVTQLAPATNDGQASQAINGDQANKKNGAPKLSYVMQMALQGALDATKAVEKYAEDSGIIDRNGDPFRFTNADIRAIGLSMFIEARKRAW